MRIDLYASIYGTFMEVIAKLNQGSAFLDHLVDPLSYVSASKVEHNKSGVIGASSEHAFLQASCPLCQPSNAVRAFI